mmetsp:Transcript_78524/g.199781  ORF Transcript_78524/g.199781 Transcript_78524/m.199781 type:complete len:276 (+) Transcript_78524:73-900(+)
MVAKKKAVVCLVVAGAAAWKAAPLFVAPGAGLARASPSAAAGAATPAPTSAAPAPSVAASAVAVAAFGALAAGSRRQRRGSARRASIMMEPEEVPEAEGSAKPKPPPFDPAKQIGVTEPIGFFDPLGFCKVGDREGFRRLRAAELKHGRAGMMAAAGAVAQYFVRIPIVFDFENAGLSAAWTGNSKYGFIFLLFLSGYLEIFSWKENSEKEPGDFGDPIGFNIYDSDMRNKELNNGRAGMIAALGIVAAELYTGKSAMETFGLPPSAFETGLTGG